MPSVKITSQFWKRLNARPAPGQALEVETFVFVASEVKDETHKPIGCIVAVKSFSDTPMFESAYFRNDIDPAAGIESLLKETIRPKFPAKEWGESGKVG